MFWFWMTVEGLEAAEGRVTQSNAEERTLINLLLLVVESSLGKTVNNWEKG